MEVRLQAKGDFGLQMNYALFYRHFPVVCRWTRQKYRLSL